MKSRMINFLIGFAICIISSLALFGAAVIIERLFTLRVPSSLLIILPVMIGCVMGIFLFGCRLDQKKWPWEINWKLVLNKR